MIYHLSNLGFKKRSTFSEVDNDNGVHLTLPDGFIGDPTKASKEKGEKLIKASVNNFANLISKIKKVKIQLF